MAWYEVNRHNMTLHPATREWVEAEIGWTKPEGDGDDA